MRTALCVCVLGLSLVAPATSARAGEAAAEKKAAPASAATVGEDGIRRDPAGVQGISPYHEALAKGRKAFQSNELDAAIAAFEEATTLDSTRLMGHLLLAQAQLAKGELEAASSTAAQARQAQGSEANMSKLLMLTAELGERAVPGAPEKPTLAAVEPKLGTAKEAWTGYSGFVAGHSKAPDYRASATERSKQIDARLEREKAYVIVKQRIADNAKEQEDKAQGEAKKAAGGR